MSATPKRADGLTKVFQWHLGEIVYLIKQREQENVDVKIINYEDENEDYSKLILNFRQKPNSPQMINNICNYFPRTLLMIDEIITCLKEGRKILVLSDRREHLKTIKEQLELNFKNNNLSYDVGYYLGGMKEKI